MKEKFKQEQIKTAQEMLDELGFSELSSRAMQIAVRLGARRVLGLHGASEQELGTELKPEAAMTPVTEADMQSGDIIKRLIFREYPNDSINEEETGLHKGENRTWYVDPLDGTSSFAREQKYSSVGISVYENGKPFLAAICHPFERELLVAEAGKGAFSFALDENTAIIGSPKKIKVSNKKSLEGGIVYIDALFNKKNTAKKLKLIKKLVESAGGRLGVKNDR